MQDEEIMQVWREANEAAMTEVVLCDDPDCRVCRDTTAIIAQAKAKWQAEAYEMAAKICEQQRQDFLSPEYATGQPLSSFQERFACGQCAEAIRTLKDS